LIADKLSTSLGILWKFIILFHFYLQMSQKGSNFALDFESVQDRM